MKKALLSTIVLGLGLGSGFATYAYSSLNYTFANYTGQPLTAQGQTVQSNQIATLEIPKPNHIGTYTHTTPITAANGEQVATVQSTLKCTVIPHKVVGPILIGCNLANLQAVGVDGYNGQTKFPGSNYIWIT